MEGKKLALISIPAPSFPLRIRVIQDPDHSLHEMANSMAMAISMIQHRAKRPSMDQAVAIFLPL
ncbi:hypothetical protein CRP01_23905 [Flavilitoribacter nigricans DSM 23189 = NBRC 102662]|uniref:Uncharacterized protein n=1 Tax=Flavilitoribacter nigricans (strain ATCC 23147 / DSM 23189 / NBRC 102662 / NCIMB 1420 / SS-2) TaxID=1122177 RepID=A0A2D0N713_FLAN2|nr:hypothetical protein CRP01_23905 [Flavilitoribacter nigricans DSM 23189 = NBRC 102662]